MSEVDWDRLDITHDELNRFTNAFKSEEFRKLFGEYCNEITDPENRRVYEAELKQLEAERGIDIKFINPEPGFVIKTTVDGKQKVFINVAKCDQIEAPSSERGQDASTGQHGLNWRIPYVQSKPKRDFDNNKTVCPVYDVVFHPDTLHLTKKNAMFKKLVIDTACDAVQTTYNVQLDLVNLKYPKMGYKGTARPTVIRKKTGDPTNFEASPIDSIYPPPPPTTTNAAAPAKGTNVKAKHRTVADYATPKYEIIHRRSVEMHEMTDELDAKINMTIPKELVVRIDLPLLSSSKDVFLDVNTKSIYLCSEKPAKYKLTIQLPFEVQKLDGKAQFDSDKRQLQITLPVVRERKLVISDLCREDSGVDSDHHSPKEDNSSGDDVFEDALETHTSRANRQDEKVVSFVASVFGFIILNQELNMHFSLFSKFLGCQEMEEIEGVNRVIISRFFG